MIKNRLFYLITGIVTLTAGIALYIIFNRNVIAADMFSFALNRIPSINYYRTAFTDLLCSYGADFLWAFSFPFFVQAIFLFKKKRIFLLLFCSLLGIITELLQYAHITTGTPDILDIITFILATVISTSIILIHNCITQKNPL